MMSEKARIWEPIESIGGRYWLEFVVDKREFIKSGNFTKINRIIKFRLRSDKEENKAVDLMFDDIASYRITNESYSDDSIDRIENEKERKERGPWGFYTIENSLFIEHIEKQTGIPASIYDFRHFYIVCMDDIIDIIAGVGPIVKILVDDKVVESNDSENRSLAD